jgi:hypothetical protein
VLGKFVGVPSFGEYNNDNCVPPNIVVPYTVMLLAIKFPFTVVVTPDVPIDVRLFRVATLALR